MELQTEIVKTLTQLSEWQTELSTTLLPAVRTAQEMQSVHTLLLIKLYEQLDKKHPDLINAVRASLNADKENESLDDDVRKTANQCLGMIGREQSPS